MKRSRGFLSRQTKKLKAVETLSVSKRMKTFSVGNKVTLAPVHYFGGLPALRYINKHGTIIEKRGSSYVVKILDGNKKKQIIVNPIHLRLC